MNKLLSGLSAAVLMAGLSGAVHAADINAGKAVFEKNACASCHGEDAKTSTSPEYPILAGQHADYLRHALRAYQRGKEGAPASSNVRNNAIMAGMAEPLSAQDIENLAAWLETLPSPLGTRR
ncbi:MAG TPA: cytochrome c [Burkholderiaceae bacterium]|nr:cytochrome c [Burkholderiaceae bacterium]